MSDDWITDAGYMDGLMHGDETPADRPDPADVAADDAWLAAMRKRVAEALEDR